MKLIDVVCMIGFNCLVMLERTATPKQEIIFGIVTLIIISVLLFNVDESKSKVKR
jgi:hypothetical protein